MQVFDKKSPSETLPDQSLALERWTPFRLFTIAARVADTLGAYYGPRYGLNRAAWRVLAVAADRPGANAGEIARAAALDPFAVSRAIRQLVATGLVERQAAPTDRRQATVAVTPAGRAVIGDLSAVALRIEAELTGGLTVQETVHLDRILGMLEEASLRIAARGWRSITDGPPQPTPDRQP